jgi:hypothetical protein
MKLPRRAGLAALFVAGAMLLGSVGMTLASGNAQVRVLHASPNAPAVDVWLDGAKVSALTDVPFGTISNYLSVPAGSHHVQVFATGTSTNPVIDTTLDLAAGRSYTVAATNDLAHIQAQVLVDDPMPVAGKAEVRVVHFSADAPAVDVAARGAAPADALVKDLSYPNATGYAQLPGGTYNLDIRLAGTTTVALALPPLTIADGNAYSVFAIGSAANPPVGGHGLQVVVAKDASLAVAPASPSPMATASLPPTTVSPSATTGGSFTPALLLALFAVAAIAAGSLTLARSRARR